MGLFRAERRDDLDVGDPKNASVLMKLFGGSVETDSGMDVGVTMAMRVSAVWRCVNLISSVGAALPGHVYRGDGYEKQKSKLLLRPNPDMTPYEFWKLSYAHRLTAGNFVAIKVNNSYGQLKELWPHAVDQVQYKTYPLRNGGYERRFKLSWTDDRGVNHEKEYTKDQIFHIPHVSLNGFQGLSPIQVARQTTGMSLAGESFGARQFRDGAMQTGILSTEKQLGQGVAERIKQNWRESAQGPRNAHEITVLGSGTTFQPISLPNADLQFIESRKFSVSEIARFFGVPPFLLMDAEKSTSWGTGLEEQSAAWVRFGLKDEWLRPTEERITWELLGGNLNFRYNLQELLRGDTEARMNLYRAMWELGSLSPNEMRANEGYAPIEHGDTYFVPMNFKELGAPDPAVDPSPAPVGDDNPDNEEGDNEEP